MVHFYSVLQSCGDFPESLVKQSELPGNLSVIGWSGGSPLIEVLQVVGIYGQRLVTRPAASRRG